MNRCVVLGAFGLAGFAVTADDSVGECSVI